MSFDFPRRPLIALSLGLALVAGCQAVAPGMAPTTLESASVDPATRALMEAVAGLAFSGSTFENDDTLVAPLQVAPAAGYAIQATAAVPAPVVVTRGDKYVTGPYPEAGALPGNYAKRATGGWLTANPVINGGTTDTYYTPGGTTAAVSALVSKTVVNGATTNESYVAPWVTVTDVPVFFKAKLNLPASYTVLQAEETYTTYTNGSLTGTAVGYRWQVTNTTGATVAWVRSVQVTQPDGSKVDHWELTYDYVTLNGKQQATKSAYGNYWEATETANQSNRTLNTGSGVVTATGVWEDLKAGVSVTLEDTYALNAGSTRKLTRKLGDGRTMTVIESFNPDNAGSGQVVIDGNFVGTLTWGTYFRGTVTLNGATGKYVASRLSTKDRPQVLDLVPPATVAPTNTSTVSGSVATVAGTGGLGSTNATGQAASFYNPSDVCRDNSGNLYVADTNNGVIRKIASTGVVTTFATGLSEPRGIVFDGNSTFYIADSYKNTIFKVGINGGGVSIFAGPNDYYSNTFADGAGTGARFNRPYGIAIDPANANLYVADTSNHRIRKIVIATATASTVAGSGTAGFVDGTHDNARFNSPQGVAVDAAGVLYVADTGSHSIRKVSVINGVSTVTAIAGNGSAGFVDANGATARFNSPMDINVDAGGNLYVTDYGNHRLRRIDLNRNVASLSGTGAAGWKDGDLTAGQFSSPRGLHLAADGSLYVTEHGTHRVRKLSLASNFATAAVPTPAPTPLPPFYVSSVAGTGGIGELNSIGADSSFYNPSDVVRDGNGNLYVADTSNGVIRKITPAGITTTFATGLSEPRGIVLDTNTNTFYIADSYKNTIFKVGINGGGVSIFAGPNDYYSNTFADGANTGARFNRPYGLTIDATNTNLYVADTSNHRIRKITISGAVTTTVAGSGTAGLVDGTHFNARLNSPQGVAVDAKGVLYIADTGNHTIRKVSIVDGVSTVSTWVGGGAAGFVDAMGGNARFNSPTDLNLDPGGNLYVSDYGNHRLRKVDVNRNVTTVTGNGTAAYQDGNFADARLSSPRGMALYSDGNVYVTEHGTHRIRRVRFADGFLNQAAPTPAPTALPANQTMTVAGTGGIGSLDSTGVFSSFYNPSDVIRDNNGNLYIADTSNGEVRKITPAGTTTTFATGLSEPRSIVFDGVSTFYIADSFKNTIFKVGINGGGVSIFAGPNDFYSNTFADGSGVGARFNRPYGLAIDPAHANLYVADTSNHRIRKIAISGAVTTTVAGSGIAGLVDGTHDNARFNSPQGLAVDAAGVVYVADTGNHTIRKVSTIDGVVSATTIAGGGSAGFVDANGTAARFNSPMDIDVDAGSNLYVTDYGNHRVRKVDLNRQVTTISGTGVAGWKDGSLSEAVYSSPRGMALNADGNLYLTEQGTHRVRRALLGAGFDAAPAPTPAPTAVPANYSTTVAGTGGQGSLNALGTTSSFYSPSDIVRDASGNLFVADTNNGVIRKISPYGLTTTFATGLSEPRSLVLDNSTGTLYIADSFKNTIFKVGKNGGGVSIFAGPNDYYSNTFADGTSTGARFNRPYGIAIDATEANLYVADTSNHRIRKIELATAKVTTFAGSGTAGYLNGTTGASNFNSPQGLAITGAGVLYVADTGNHTIRKVESGSVTTLAGNGAAGFADGVGTAARFSSPIDVAIDPSGLLVSDYGNHRIRRIGGTTVSTLAGNGTAGWADGPFGGTVFSSPRGLTFSNGSLYVTEHGTHRVRRLQF